MNVIFSPFSSYTNANSVRVRQRTSDDHTARRRLSPTTSQRDRAVPLNRAAAARSNKPVLKIVTRATTSSGTMAATTAITTNTGNAPALLAVVVPSLGLFSQTPVLGGTGKPSVYSAAGGGLKHDPIIEGAGVIEMTTFVNIPEVRHPPQRSRSHGAQVNLSLHVYMNNSPNKIYSIFHSFCYYSFYISPPAKMQYRYFHLVVPHLV